MDKPVLYNNHILPIEALSDEKFADFIYDIIPHIFDDVETIGSPPKTWDGGFDVRAKHKSEDYFICIQCKRYQNKLSLQQIAHELAKVALTSKNNNFETREHYFFTIQGVSKDAYFLEDPTRTNLKEEAIKELKKEKNFKTVKTSLLSKYIDTEETVIQYITNLQIIDIFDKRTIDGKIGKRWDIFLSNIAEHYFTVQTVEKKDQRPNFCFEEYIYKINNSYKQHYNDYSAEYQDDISNLSRYNDNQIRNISFKKVLVKNLSYYLPPDSISFLKGIGGLGKTTSCEIIRYNYINLHNSEKINLPILIKASNYKYIQDITKLINLQLNIDYGLWHSLPYNFMLIIDGLNEVSDAVKEKLIKELELDILSKKLNIPVLITIREGKILSELKIDKLGIIAELSQLTFIDIRKLSRKHLSQYNTEQFLISLDNKYMDFDIIRTPFFIIKALEKYKETKTLPTNIGELLFFYFTERFKKNIANIPTKFRSTIDAELIFDLLSRISYYIRVDKKTNSIKIKEIVKYLKNIFKEDEFNILGDLGANDILELLVSFEILITENKIYQVEHDIIADYFASSMLAEKWEANISLLRNKENKLLWIFTASFLKQEQLNNFLTITASNDLILACQCYNNIFLEKANVLFDIIISKYKIARPYYYWLSSEAFTILNNPKYEVFLLQEYNNSKKDSYKQIFLKRSLAKIGNKTICAEVLADAEEESSIPFLTVSNGDEELWNKIPLNIKLSYTRKRAKNIINKLNKGASYNKYKEGCDLSLKNLITIGGSNEDILLAKQVFEISKEHSTCYYAFFLILINDYDNNKQYLKQSLKKFNYENRYSIATEAIIYGRYLFNDEDNESSISILSDIFTIQEAIQNNDYSDWSDVKKDIINNPEILKYLQRRTTLTDAVHFLNSISQEISKYLKSIFLNESCAKIVFTQLNKNKVLQTKSIFWDLCVINNISKTKELSIKLLDSTNLNIVSKAICFLDSAFLIDKNIENIICEIIVINEDKWMTYEYFEILKISLHYNNSKIIIDLINDKLRFLLIDATDEIDDNSEIAVIRYLELASKIVFEIDKKIIYASFSFFAAGFYKDYENIYMKLISNLSEKEIDDNLEIEILYNKNFLLALSKITKTPKRIELMLAIFSKATTLQIYDKIIKNYWCDEIAQFVFNSLICEERKDELNNYDKYHYLYTKDQVSKFVMPEIENTHYEEKINIIQFWCDSAENRE